MKNRSIAILAVVLVAIMAGSALAHGHGHGRFRGGGYGMGAGQGWGGGANIDIPQNIRDKMTEAQKLAIDMRAEFMATNPDRNKALAARDKYMKAEKEVADWFFKQHLDAREKGDTAQWHGGMGMGMGFGPGMGGGWGDRQNFNNGPGGVNRNSARPAIDIPQNIRDKMIDAQRQRVELNAQMNAAKPDRAKILAAREQCLRTQRELSDWFFMQRLETSGGATPVK